MMRPHFTCIYVIHTHIELATDLFNNKPRWLLDNVIKIVQVEGENIHFGYTRNNWPDDVVKQTLHARLRYSLVGPAFCLSGTAYRTVSSL